ncbi:MAG: ABC transporter permease [Firmicutes bacterium]|nr:ABC transporter permease [Bacillota bacterium]MDY3658653.1 ABC transporter permease [Eubacteriales bacterium]
MKLFNRKEKKLNYSKEHKLYVRKLTCEKWIIRLIQVLILALIFVLWEVLTKYYILDPFFISSPSRMIKTISDLYNSGELFKHIGITLYETVIGFVLATAIGYIIAVILWWSERLRKIFDPYIVVLNSLPKIALGPLIIIWFGAGTSAIIVMCILICVIITTLSVLGSFLSCDKDKILLMKSMKAKKYQIFFKLIVPNSMPDFISVLKINVGMSWVGTIMGEYLVSKAGLGYLIVYGGTVFKLDLVMTSTVILCLLAGGMYFVVSRIEARFKR